MTAPKMPPELTKECLKITCIDFDLEHGGYSMREDITKALQKAYEAGVKRGRKE